MTQIGPVDQLCLVFSTLADGWPSIVLKTNGFPLPSKGLEGEEGSCGGGREWKRCTCQWERCECPSSWGLCSQFILFLNFQLSSGCWTRQGNLSDFCLGGGVVAVWCGEGQGALDIQACFRAG